MDKLLPLASALGVGMLAGARLYATVLAVGLLIRFHWLTLPPAWDQASVLGDSRILIVSALACATEFIADKVPWVDSAWDSIHTFIRPIGAVLIASSLFSGLEPVYKMLLLLVAGGVAITGHSAKAAARLAVNHSPEPFSNAAVSLSEDAAVAGGIYMLVKHPWVMASIALGFLLLFAWLAPRLFRALRAEWATLGAAIRNWFGEPGVAELDYDGQQWMQEHWRETGSCRLFRVISSGGLKGIGNRSGTLCLKGGEAVLLTRKWGHLVARESGPLSAIEVARRPLADDLVLVLDDGQRWRFDLLAGQFEGAREEKRRLSTASRGA
jgi:hypothetical protein